MRAAVSKGLGLALLLWASSAQAQGVRLGRPEPLAGEATPSPVQRVSLSTPVPLARAQAPDAPPPPPFPGGGPLPGPAPGPVVSPFQDQTPYNCGVVNTNADQGGWWDRCGRRLRRCFGDVTGGVGGVFQPGQGRTAFASDHCFDYFASPVTNPVYFEDPRALTEFRPVFVWQKTPDENPIWAGGNNYMLNLQGRVAFTPYFSLVVHQLGWTWINPDNALAGVEADSGFSEIKLGPKYTFLRNEQTGTVAAAGLIFELPVGSDRVFQDTGTLSLTPYLSFAQNFGKTTWGSFNFMNTTGYSFSVDDERYDFLYSSFHLDYNVANSNMIYPFVELNWFRYTTDGTARDWNIGGAPYFNFGSNDVSGLNTLNLAVGARFKYSEAIQFGVAAGFDVLSNENRRLDDFYMVFDMIFRY